MWMCGHFNQSGYKEESAAQKVFMGVNCHDHVSKKVGKRKKKHQAHLILFVYFKKSLEVISENPRSSRVSYQDHDPPAATIRLPPYGCIEGTE